MKAQIKKIDTEKLTADEALIEKLSGKTIENIGNSASRQVHYNRPQLRAMIVGANEQYHVWARGTGKSEGLMAPWAARNMEVMPRSRGAFVARTYLQLLERTLPPVIKGWESMGYKRGEDFWVREKPPKKANVPSPIVGPCNAEHSIFWKNGSVISMISQDRAGSANSMTLHWGGGDEAKFLDKNKLDTEFAPANRGDGRYFDGIPEFHGLLFCTDMPTDSAAKWILEKEQEMDEQRIELILAIQLDIFELSQKALVKPITHRKAIYERIEYRRKQWDRLRANTVHYTEACTLDNIEAFGVKNYLRLKKTLPSFVFSTAILNKRRTNDGKDFYPDLNPSNFYDAINYSYTDKYTIGQSRPDDCRKDSDLDHDKPLLMGMDYNSSINPMAIGQLHGRHLNIINSLHVLSPLRLRDAAVHFVKYYQDYKRKHLIYGYDHTGIPTNATINVPYADQFCDTVAELGWTVEKRYIGYTSSYMDRYELWGKKLRSREVSFNRTNTETLAESMRNSKTIQGSKGFEKDKRAERDYNNDQRHTTHYSDAGDTLLILADQLINTEAGQSYDFITA